MSAYRRLVGCCTLAHGDLSNGYTRDAWLVWGPFICRWPKAGLCIPSRTATKPLQQRLLLQRKITLSEMLVQSSPSASAALSDEAGLWLGASDPPASVNTNNTFPSQAPCTEMLWVWRCQGLEAFKGWVSLQPDGCLDSALPHPTTEAPNPHLSSSDPASQRSGRRMLSWLAPEQPKDRLEASVGSAVPQAGQTQGKDKRFSTA